ncbi:MAG: eukaryotic-like serine/threonine-protein kinase [Mycobacteriales bacterium]
MALDGWSFAHLPPERAAGGQDDRGHGTGQQADGGRPGGWTSGRLSGQLIARRYRLRGRLGSGGMGVVWRADDEILRRPVAVKEVSAEDVAEDAFRLVLNEARAAAQIDHPGVVRVYDIVADERPWLVMELLGGRTLAELMRSHGPVLTTTAATIGMRLAEALQAIHRAGLVHGDVKPGNVQVCDGDRVVLTDFGIASVIGQPVAAPEMIVGSPAYMSPERVHGTEMGPPADVFSLGATLYAAVEGRPPFDNSSPAASIAAVLHDPPRPAERVGPLWPIIQAMLVKEPRRRMELEQVWLALQAVSARHRSGGETGERGSRRAVAGSRGRPATGGDR